VNKAETAHRLGRRFGRPAHLRLRPPEAGTACPRRGLGRAQPLDRRSGTEVGADEGEAVAKQRFLQPVARRRLEMGDVAAVAIDRRGRRLCAHGAGSEEGRQPSPELGMDGGKRRIVAVAARRLDAGKAKPGAVLEAELEMAARPRAAFERRRRRGARQESEDGPAGELKPAPCS